MDRQIRRLILIDLSDVSYIVYRYKCIDRQLDAIDRQMVLIDLSDVFYIDRNVWMSSQMPQIDTQMVFNRPMCCVLHRQKCIDGQLDAIDRQTGRWFLIDLSDVFYIDINVQIGNYIYAIYRYQIVRWFLIDVFYIDEQLDAIDRQIDRWFLIELSDVFYIDINVQIGSQMPQIDRQIDGS